MILRSVSGMIVGGQDGGEEKQTMDVEEILQQLATNTGTFPREAVAQAIAQREAITPELLRVLAEAQHNIDDLQESDSMAHIYAMYLLAQFREPRAYPLIVEFFSIPGDIALDTTGDVATEDLGRILASVSCGDIWLMTTLVENEHANEYVRVAALRGLVTLVACGEQSRDDIVAYYHQLFQGKIARDISFVWNGLVSASNALYPEELYDEIKRAYDDELIETFFIRLEDIDATLKRGKERVLDELQHNPRYSLITDTITEMEWWACFHPQEREAPNLVSEAHPRVKLAQQKAKDKRKRKLAKAARRRNRR
jgi:Protein of unknown function (DUF1186)